MYLHVSYCSQMKVDKLYFHGMQNMCIFEKTEIRKYSLNLC